MTARYKQRGDNISRHKKVRDAVPRACISINVVQRRCSVGWHISSVPRVMSKADHFQGQDGILLFRCDYAIGPPPKDVLEGCSALPGLAGVLFSPVLISTAQQTPR